MPNLTTTELCRATGVRKSTVVYWANKAGVIPAERRIESGRAMNFWGREAVGAIKAAVRNGDKTRSKKRKSNGRAADTAQRNGR